MSSHMFTGPMAARPPSSHRILMNFMLRGAWHISFLEEDCRTSLPRKLTFQSADKIVEMQERWGEHRTLDALQQVEHGIEIGRGGVWLRLSPEQYSKLKR